MKNHRIIILPLILLVSSCKHYYYMPNVQNVPLFKEKNEYRLSGSVGTGDEAKTKEVQAAYSITKECAVMANFMSAEGGNGDNAANGYLLEAAIGYFKPIKEYCVFEVYGGFGQSSQHHQYGAQPNGTMHTSDLGFTRVFLQPAIGVTFDAFDFAFSSRFGSLTFYKVDEANTANGAMPVLEQLSQDHTSILIEPALTIRGGWKYVKAQVQLLVSRNLDEDKTFEKVNLSLSLYLSIAKRYRKRVVTGNQ